LTTRLRLRFINPRLPRKPRLSFTGRSKSETACGSGRLISDIDQSLLIKINRPLPQAVLT
jgi:hypothetical protein